MKHEFQALREDAIRRAVESHIVAPLRIYDVVLVAWRWSAPFQLADDWHLAFCQIWHWTKKHKPYTREVSSTYLEGIAETGADEGTLRRLAIKLGLRAGLFEVIDVKRRIRRSLKDSL